MKKGLLSILMCTVTLLGFSQSEKYLKTMSEKMIAVDSTRSVEGLTDLANTFERIGDAEKTQWLPYYYAAYCQMMVGYNMQSPGSSSGGGAGKVDMQANKAEELINKASILTKENSEIWVVRKMIATLRMNVDPMNRFMQMGPIAAEALAKAKAMNPANPRVYLLEGQDKFFTPEQFGGDKKEAKRLFEVSIAKFESFKPESNIHPNWGLDQAKYFLSRAQ